MSKNAKELLTAVLIVLLTGFVIGFGFWNIKLREQNTYLRSVNAELVQKAELRTEQLSRCCGILVEVEPEITPGIKPDHLQMSPAAWAGSRR